jgi:hypothetical protein
MAIASIALLVALLAAASATFAWYIYNTRAHTTSVHMAAGSNVSIEISNKYDGEYGSSTVLDSFVGYLSPVSTDQIIADGVEKFQKVEKFTEGSGKPLAKDFSAAKETDFYMTSVFIRSKNADAGLYISSLTFEDGDEKNPISSAIRLGFVVHESGQNKSVADEYIFSISDAKNPQRDYNTFNGVEGHVLDHRYTDGTTIKFDPYTKDAFVDYDKDSGEITIKTGSVKLCDLKNDVPTQVDIYIWLEGCDEDCTSSLGGATLKDVSLSFVGYIPEEKRQ